MKIEEAIVGTKVVSLVDFCGVPKGTIGIIDEEYENKNGIVVAWDLPDRPLPIGYTKYNNKLAIHRGQPLRDGFNKQTELKYLQVL
jgi:hypothetical protein